MKLDHPNILPECYADTNLIQYLMHGTVNHQHNCNKVVGTLKGRFSDRFAVGIIDCDKVEVGYLSDCEQVACTQHLTLWKHREFPHFLMTVSPAIDRFLLDCARERNVRPERFGLASQLKPFTEQTKQATSSTDSHIRELIIAIKDNPEIRCLGNTLHYLQKKTYQADLTEIKTLMASYSFQ